MADSRRELIVEARVAGNEEDGMTSLGGGWCRQYGGRRDARRALECSSRIGDPTEGVASAGKMDNMRSSFETLYFYCFI